MSYRRTQQAGLDALISLATPVPDAYRKDDDSSRSGD